jgi:hypothetical protein
MTPDSPSIPELERELLGALCSIVLPSATREHAIRALAKYEWTTPDHRVVYEALRRAGKRDAGEIREHLRADVTRLGFPDIEWAPYFEARILTAADIDMLTRTLLNVTPDAPNPA